MREARWTIGDDAVLAQRGADDAAVADVCVNERDTVRDGVAVARGEAVEHDDPMVGAKQRPDDVRADEPCSPGHEDVHGNNSRLQFVSIRPRFRREASYKPRSSAMSTSSKVTVPSAFLAVALAAAACSHDQPPPVTPTAPPAPPTTTSAPAHQGPDPAVNLSQDIMGPCQVKVSNEPPKFDYDSSNLSSQERDILAQVAKCLTTGPLAGRRVKLTGRANPRGEQEYNMNLGEHRATSVRKYLVGLGVAEAGWPRRPVGRSTPRATTKPAGKPTAASTSVCSR